MLFTAVFLGCGYQSPYLNVHNESLDGMTHVPHVVSSEFWVGLEWLESNPQLFQIIGLYPLNLSCFKVPLF